jgi:transposase
MCELLVGLPDVNVLEVVERDGQLVVTVATRGARPLCGECGGSVSVKDRTDVSLADLPCFGRRTVLVWRKLRWSCPAAACGMSSFTEQVAAIAAPRLAITDRAGRWATVQVGRHGRSVTEVASDLGCGWHAVMDAVVAYGEALIDDPDRFGDVEALGLDETLHVRLGPWRTQQWSTQIVDVFAGQLLDVVEGRSSIGPCEWLTGRSAAWLDGVAWATLDLSGPYRKVFDTMLPDATQVADPFHVTKLANTKLDECRRRVQNETMGHRGRKDDPLYRCRRLLTKADERLDEKGRNGAALSVPPRSDAVTQRYQADRSCRRCPHEVPDLRRNQVARLGRVSRVWASVPEPERVELGSRSSGSVRLEQRGCVVALACPRVRRLEDLDVGVEAHQHVVESPFAGDDDLNLQTFVVEAGLGLDAVWLRQVGQLRVGHAQPQRSFVLAEVEPLGDLGVQWRSELDLADAGVVHAIDAEDLRLRALDLAALEIPVPPLAVDPVRQHLAVGCLVVVRPHVAEAEGPALVPRLLGRRQTRRRGHRDLEMAVDEAPQLADGPVEIGDRSRCDGLHPDPTHEEAERVVVRGWGRGQVAQPVLPVDPQDVVLVEEELLGLLDEIALARAELEIEHGLEQLAQLRGIDADGLGRGREWHGVLLLRQGEDLSENLEVPLLSQGRHQLIPVNATR